MEAINKIWQYVKNNKLYLLVMLIGSIAFLLQMNEVVLYADDFSLGIVSKGGFSNIFKYFKTNYLTWGGRINSYMGNYIFNV